jgi:hypothetical protein
MAYAMRTICSSFQQRDVLQTVSLPANAQFCLLCTLLLVCCCMFRHIGRPRGAYINNVRTYSKKKKYFYNILAYQMCRFLLKFT